MVPVSGSVRWRSRAAWSALALLVGLALAEFAARRWGPPPQQRPQYEGEIRRASEAPGRGWESIPDSLMRIRFGGAGQRLVEHRIGTHGWRGAPFEPRAELGVVRIACVGDSNVFGWGVAEHETWPALLQRELDAAGWRAQVLNLGVPNTDAEEKVALAEQVAFALECETVLVGLHFDDLILEGIERGRLAGRARALGWTRRGATPWLDAVRAHLRCVDLVVEAYRQRLVTRAYLARKEQISRVGHPARERVEQALERLAAQARERGIELLAIVVPMPVRDGAGFASATVDQALSDAAERAGIETIPVAAELSRCAGEVWVDPLDLHLCAEGNAVIARAVARRLVSTHLRAGDPSKR